MNENVLKAVKKTFGDEPEKADKVEEGLIHETFSVEVNGEKFIVQFSGKEDEHHSALEQCLKMYSLLEGTVPVPEAVTDEVGEVNGREFIIVENIQGRTGEQNINPQKTSNAGKNLAKIHSYRHFEKEGWLDFEEDIPRITEFREENLKRKKLSELEEKLEIFEEKGLEEVAEKTEAFIEEYGETFPEEFDPVLVHDDFTPDNLIFRGDEIAGVIDMDYAFSGLDARNIVKSANGFWMHDPGADWDIREKFYEGYRDERPLPENFETLEKFFRVETLVHLVGSMLKLDELSEKEKEFYRDEILEEIRKVEQNP